MADGNYNNAMNLTLESGDIPDIILKVWPNEVESYALKGILLPFSDYEEYMPHFMAYIDDNNLQEKINQLRLDNGKYYILPGYTREVQSQQWIYRKDLFEKHNISVPETYDELFENLVTLKEIYPESTPISASWGGAHLFSMMGAGYNISAGWSGFRNYDQQTNRWFYTHSSENYKNMLQNLNRCYEAGLLDPETFTQSNDEFVNKLTDGSAFVSVSWITSGFDNWDEKLEENGQNNGTWYPLRVPETTMGISKLPPVSVFKKGLIIPNTIIENDDFEKILKFLDWAIYSEEGIELTYWGVEGLTFERGENGNVLLDNIKSPKNIDGDIDLSADYGFNLFFNLNESRSYEDYKKPDYIVDFLDKSFQNKDTQEETPDLILSDNEMIIVDNISDKLVGIANEYTEKFIKGELNFEDDWSDYISILNDNGAEVMEKIWNDAWQSKE
jgi:putative aldouronate transport system substrate-binding protein